MPEKAPLRLLFDPDEYLCTWRIPDSAGGWVDVPGVLVVAADSPPEATIYGTLPIVTTETEGGTFAAHFPQVVPAPVLRGHLANGGHVALLDASINYWLPGQGHIRAAAAVLSHREVIGEEPSFKSVKLQVGGLDWIAGIGPIKSTSWPAEGSEHLAGTWSAEGEPASSQTWTDDGATLRLEYDGSARTFDPYFYSLAFSPVAHIQQQQPVSLRSWVDDWVEPLRRIVSLATGRRQDLTFLSVTVAQEEEVSRAVRGQVSGTRITQAPFAAKKDQQPGKASAVYLKPDGISLLSLVRAWQQLAEAHHPLLETYGERWSCLQTNTHALVFCCSYRP